MTDFIFILFAPTEYWGGKNPLHTLKFLNGSAGVWLELRPTARKGHKHCQWHNITTSLLLWGAQILLQQHPKRLQGASTTFATEKRQELKACPVLL